MIADFVGVDDARWREALRRIRHDVYHLPDYAAVAGRHESGSPIAFHAVEGDHCFVMPLLLRTLPSALGAPTEWRDVTSPYGYSGPIVSDRCSPALVREFMGAFVELARSHHIVSAFVRLHPLCGVPTETFDSATRAHHGSVVRIDLTRPLEELWAETRKDHRHNIRRLTRAGFVATIDDWSADASFKTAYRTTMDRLAADDFYYFPNSYFDDLRESLGDRLHLCSVRAPNGDVACAGLFTGVGGIVQYHLSGTVTEYLRWAPSKLMLDAVRTWASQRGDTVMNLGGAPDPKGTLMLFKGGFSRSRADFHTVRLVIDADRYATLARVERSQTSRVNDPETFFPAYRRPRTPTGGRRVNLATAITTAALLAADEFRWSPARYDFGYVPPHVVATASLDGPPRLA